MQSVFCLSPLEQRLYELYIEVLSNNNNILNQWSAATFTPIGKNKTSQEVRASLYQQLSLCKNVVEVIFIEEKSLKGMNHIHGMMLTSRSSKYKKITDLVVLTKPLYNVKGWIKYISKNKPRFIYKLTKGNVEFIY